MTRICAATTISGVPVGTQMAWLSINRTGWPLERMRVEPVIHWAVTHGPFAIMGGGNKQPATTYGAVILTMGCPLTVTRGFGTVGCACPKWEQRTCAPTWSRNPGMAKPSLFGVLCATDEAPTKCSAWSYDHHCAVIDGYSRAGHDDAGALSILDRDSHVIHNDGGARSALQHDAACGAGKIAHHDGILGRRLKNDVGTRRDAGQCQYRHLRHQPPVSAYPDRIIGISLLEFHPNSRSHLRDEERSHLLTRNRNARHGPTRRQQR